MGDENMTWNRAVIGIAVHRGHMDTKAKTKTGTETVDETEYRTYQTDGLCGHPGESDSLRTMDVERGTADPERLRRGRDSHQGLFDRSQCLRDGGLSTWAVTREDQRRET